MVKMLFGKIPFDAWVGLLIAFPRHGATPTDGDVLRFLGVDSLPPDQEKQARLYFMYK